MVSEAIEGLVREKCASQGVSLLQDILAARLLSDMAPRRHKIVDTRIINPLAHFMRHDGYICTTSEHGSVTTLEVRHAIRLAGVSNSAGLAVVVTENATVVEIGGIVHGEN